jgi:hypothetical protein
LTLFSAIPQAGGFFMGARMIRDGLLTSEKINKCSDFEECLFVRLMLVADDFGRYYAIPELVKSHCYPFDNRTLEQVKNGLKQLELIGLIKTYESGDKKYLLILNFSQRLRQMKSKFPDPPLGLKDLQENLSATCGGLPQHAVNCPPELEVEEEVEENRDSNSRISGNQKAIKIPPTIEEVVAYCAERKNNIKPQNFIDHYTARGWMIGKNRMKDWKAAIRTWENRDNEPIKQKITDPNSVPFFHY